ncbi:MAG: glycosyltransferase family 4 protein [Coriobacteriales bacterium]
MESRKHDRLRIALVVNHLREGGCARIISTLANHLSRRHEIVLVLRDDSDIGYPLPRKAQVICERMDSASYVLGYFRTVYNGLRKANPDIALVFGPGMCGCSLVTRILRGTRAKIVISERNCPHNDYSTWIQRTSNKLLYRFANGGVFQTDDAFAYWQHWCHRNPIKLPNPLAPELAARAPRPKGLLREKRIVTAGRLAEQKNQAQLIRAFASIAAEFPDHTLEIYGEGSLRPRLEQLIGELGLGNRVILKGRVATDEIYGCVQDAELFVLPSLWEGLPNALIEAMALGLPCIASDCSIGGPRELIDDGVDGLLVPVGDEDALAEAMRELLGNPTRAEELGERARAVAERLDPSVVCDAWEDYLIAIAGERD